MSSPIDSKGGPAFPQRVQRGPETTDYYGLAARDYFAAKAMQGICAHSDGWGKTIKQIGEVAYEIADAMLKAREAA